MSFIRVLVDGEYVQLFRFIDPLEGRQQHRVSSTIAVLRKILDEVRVYADNPDRYAGRIGSGKSICATAYSLSKEMPEELAMSLVLQSAFHFWPKSSGDSVFPVPAPHFWDHIHFPHIGQRAPAPRNEGRAAASYFNTVKGNHYEMWSPDVEYGRARRELLDFLVEIFSTVKFD